MKHKCSGETSEETQAYVTDLMLYLVASVPHIAPPVGLAGALIVNLLLQGADKLWKNWLNVSSCESPEIVELHKAGFVWKIMIH